MWKIRKKWHKTHFQENRGGGKGNRAIGVKDFGKKKQHQHLAADIVRNIKIHI